MKRLLILSGKGGTGKTTTAAAFIRFADARVTADCDVDAPNLHLVKVQKGTPEIKDFIGGDKAVIDAEQCIGCGECQKVCRYNAVYKKNDIYQINEYACEGCGVCAYVCPKQAVTLNQDVAGEQQLYLDNGVFSTAMLKMGRGNSGKLVTSVKMDMLKHASEEPLAIVDGSPGIGCPVIASISGMDLVLVVAEPSVSGVSDLKRLIKTTETFQTRLAVCVNRWDISPEGTQQIQEFCEQMKIPFVGKIPYDKNASRAINNGMSIADIDCPARDALQQVYEAVKKLLEIK